MKLLSVDDVVGGVAAHFSVGEFEIDVFVFIPAESWDMLRSVERGKIPLLDEIREAYIRGQQ